MFLFLRVTKICIIGHICCRRTHRSGWFGFMHVLSEPTMLVLPNISTDAVLMARLKLNRPQSVLPVLGHGPASSFGIFSLLNFFHGSI